MARTPPARSPPLPRPRRRLARCYLNAPLLPTALLSLLLLSCSCSDAAAASSQHSIPFLSSSRARRSSPSSSLPSFLRPSSSSSSSAASALTPALLDFANGVADPNIPHRVVSADLEVRQPRPLQPGTTRGFHPVLHLHGSPEPPPRTRLHAVLRALRRRLPGAAARARASAYHSVPLYGGMVAVGEYYARIKLGGQTVRVQIDTGSATLAVPLAECKNCKKGDMRYSVEKSDSGRATRIACEDARCGKNSCRMFGCGKCSSTQACCARSDTTMCSFHLNFGDGSGAKGILVEDELTWGDVKFPVIFGGINSDSPDFERAQVDGILGMAYPSLACNPSCITPAFESLRNAVKIKDLFTICITYDSGRIILGDYDPALSTRKVHWVPIEVTHPPSFYSFPLSGKMLMDGKPVDLPYYKRAIVDSGTTLIVFTHQTFDAFKRELQSKYCEVPGLCGPNSWFRPAHCTKLTDEERDKLPTLRFTLSSFQIKLEPKDYLINYASKGPEFWCVGIMALNSMSGGVDVIFGNTVMKKYVTVYDRENSRVGFALSDTKCAGAGRKTAADATPSPSPPAATAAAVPVPAAAPTPATGGSSEPGDSGSAPYANGGGSPRGGAIPGTGVNAADCAAAANCSACVHAGVGAQKCKWNRTEKRCVEGEGGEFECVLEKLPSNMFLIVGGLVAVVIGAIVVVALVVAAVRKRRYAAVPQDDDESEEEPLARQPGRADAFALEDDNES